MRPSELRAHSPTALRARGRHTRDPGGRRRASSTKATAWTRGERLVFIACPAAHAAELGLDREWECRVLERAEAAGLAPIVECCEPREGILVARWVARPRHGHGASAAARRISSSIALLVRRIHALAVPQGARAG